MSEEAGRGDGVGGRDVRASLRRVHGQGSRLHELLDSVDTRYERAGPRLGGGGVGGHYVSDGGEPRLSHERRRSRREIRRKPCGGADGVLQLRELSLHEYLHGLGTRQ